MLIKQFVRKAFIGSCMYTYKASNHHKQCTHKYYYWLFNNKPFVVESTMNDTKAASEDFFATKRGLK